MPILLQTTDTKACKTEITMICLIVFMSWQDVDVGYLAKNGLEHQMSGIMEDLYLFKAFYEQVP